MGATNYSNVWKNCATCDCWQGDREASAERDAVMVDGSAVGKCTGFWEGQRKYGNDKCTEWKAWRQLTAERVVKHRVWPPVD